MKQAPAHEPTEHHEELIALASASDDLHQLEMNVQEGIDVKQSRNAYDDALAAYRTAICDFNDGSDAVEGDQWDYEANKELLKLFEVSYQSTTKDKHWRQKFRLTDTGGAEFIDPEALMAPPTIDVSSLEKLKRREKANVSVINERIAYWHERLNPDGEQTYLLLYTTKVIEGKEVQAGAYHSSIHWEHADLLENGNGICDIRFTRAVLSLSPADVRSIVDHEVFHRFEMVLAPDREEPSVIFTQKQKAEFEAFKTDILATNSSFFFRFINETNTFQLKTGGHAEDNLNELLATTNNLFGSFDGTTDHTALERHFQRMFQQTSFYPPELGNENLVRTQMIDGLGFCMKTLKDAYAQQEATATKPQLRVLAILKQNLVKGQKAVSAWKKESE